jgi:polar amino acid transport system substrate-binding protein
MHRRLALALGCALLLTPLGGRLARADALGQVTEAKKLRVAVPQDFPPFGSVGPDLQPLGYDADMAQLLAEKMGVEPELVPVTSANRIPYLTTGKVDLIISSLGEEPGSGEGDRFLGRLRPILQRCVRAGGGGCWEARGP